jgi:hypothetical protein
MTMEMGVMNPSTNLKDSVGWVLVKSTFYTTTSFHSFYLSYTTFRVLSSFLLIIAEISTLGLDVVYY